MNRQEWIPLHSVLTHMESEIIDGRTDWLQQGLGSGGSLTVE